MKLARVVTVVGLGLSVGGIFALQACSSSSSSSGGGSAGTVPPVLPSGATATTATTEHNFALHTLQLGDTTRAGATSTTAWKDYGYNIDGKISTPTSTDLCTVAAGAKKSAVYQDGTNGIDNSFGENILPIITSVAGADAASKINQSINSGGFTIQFDITGLSDDPTQTASGITGFLNAGGAFDADGGTTPTWTTADNWPL